MFLCDKCHADSGYTCFHMAMSLGRCEGCGEVRSCADCTAYKARVMSQYGVPRWIKPVVPDLPVNVPPAPPPRGSTEDDGPKERCPRCFAPRGAIGCSSCRPKDPPWDPESLRDQFPDSLSESFGRKLIEDAAVASGEHPPLFGAK